MTERDEKFKLDPYINLIFKRRWLIIIPFCLAMIVGIYLAITLPKVYQASTLIMIEPQTVPSSFVRTIISTDVDSRITTIQLRTAAGVSCSITGRTRTETVNFG